MRVRIISKKHGTHEFLIDDEDYWRLAGWSFYLWTTPRHHGLYVHCYSPDNRSVPQRLHRVITNAKRGQMVDHINGNPLDNRKSNLRIVDALVNNQNARKRKDGETSKYKGVNWDKRSGQWKAQIQISGRKIALGYYPTEDEAALAYNQCLDENNIAGPRNMIEQEILIVLNDNAI